VPFLARTGAGEDIVQDLKQAANPAESQGSLLVLALLALPTGAAAGLVGALFRLALERANDLRDVLIVHAHDATFEGFLFVVLTCSASALIAAWLVRRFSPHASGSGIPYVEAVLHGQLYPSLYGLVLVKFVGGILAIGSGLALGREGPCVQMGARLGYLAGQLCRCSFADCRVLFAAGAGAGLATAFNAPFAGALFVLEELVQVLDRRIAIAALAASATAIVMARMLLGDAPDFHVQVFAHPPAGAQPLFFVLGGLAGLLAIAYNRSLLATLAAAGKLRGLPVEIRAGLIGALVGSVAWFAPALVGGGDAITQRMLAGTETLALVPLAFAVRFGLGAISYAAATPGGLFAPLLALGAQSGLFFGAVCHLVLPELDIRPEAFALVGMAAFFSGTVRAPLTGMVLVCEMTSNVTMLLPMLEACFTAALVPALLHNAPIYDSLREDLVRREQARRSKITSGKELTGANRSG
jgi:CIC family chloride channel protein